jgi:hypothetical protein
MTERTIMLNNFSNNSFEPRTSNNDSDRPPKQTFYDFSFRSAQNSGYVVGQHQNKTIFNKKNFNVKKWIKAISTCIWAFVVDLYLDVIVKKLWIWLSFLFRTPTKKWIQYQTIHYYPSPRLSPISSHVLRYDIKPDFL